MLSANRVRNTLFKTQDLEKLDLKRLKAFKKSCEARQEEFSYNLNDDEVVFVASNPEHFSERVIKEYETWSLNMTLIRLVIKEKTNNVEK